MYLNTVAHLYMYIHITQSPWFRVIYTISITYATFPRHLSNFKQTNNQDDRGTREVLITFSHDRMYYYYKEETNPVIPYLIF